MGATRCRERRDRPEHLLAFSIEAWWDGRLARERERLILAGLEEDFVESLDELENVTGQLGRVDSASRQLLDLTGPIPPAVSTRTLDSLIAELIVGDTYEPANATLASLLSSDGLGALSNPELRIALSLWSQQLDAVRSREEFVTHHIRFQLIPFLFLHAPVRTLDALSAPAIGGREPSEFPLRSRELLSSLEFENMVNERMFTVNRVLVELEELRLETDRVLATLAAELDG